MAAIFANGAYHLLIGEDHNVLTEGYYPNYGNMSETFKPKVRRFYDFIVRFRDLLFPPDLVDISMTHTGGYNREIGRDNEIEFSHEHAEFSPHGEANTIWTIAKENEYFQVIHLINLMGLDHTRWNEQHSTSPSTIKNITVNVLVETHIEEVYWASPDLPQGEPQRLPVRYVQGTNGKMLQVVIPHIEHWCLLYFRKYSR